MEFPTKPPSLLTPPAVAAVAAAAFIVALTYNAVQATIHTYKDPQSWNQSSLVSEE